MLLQADTAAVIYAQLLMLCPSHMFMLHACHNYMSPQVISGQHATCCSRLLMMHAAINILTQPCVWNDMQHCKAKQWLVQAGYFVLACMSLQWAY